ncbi:MAG: hypothetical protein AABW86_00960 [Candidatus Micrarchaeota archaeon]
MRLFVVTMVVLTFLMGNLFSQSAQEKAALIVQPAIVNLEATVLFTVKINSAFLGYPELAGRSYAITEKKQGAGFLINGDGYLFSSSTLIPQENDSEFLSDIALAISTDLGRIEHIKMFGTEPGNSEINAFSEYLYGLNGGKDVFFKILFSAINSGNISVIKSKNPTIFAFFNETNPEELLFINESDGLVFAKADGKNFLTLGLSNDSNNLSNISNGDTVYIVSFNNSNFSISTAVASVASVASVTQSNAGGTASPNSVSFNNPYGSFPPYLPGIVFDSSSRVWGVSSGGSTTPSSEIVRASNQAGIVPSKSEADKSYEQGMTALWDGDNQMAEFFLEDVISDNSKQSGEVGKHLNSARSAKLDIKIPELSVSSLNGFSPFVIPALAILAAVFLIAKFILGRRRRSH